MKKITKRIGLGLSILVCFGAVAQANLSSADPPAAMDESLTTDEPEGRFIGTLQTNQEKIRLYTSARGPLYTVETPDGKVLLKQVRESEIRHRLPDVYRKLERATAAKIWAGMDIAPPSLNFVPQ